MSSKIEMRILFLHGWTSKPGGMKPIYLSEHGHDVLNPALPDDDFDEAVRIARAEFESGRPDVVVGSSRGGSVAMSFDSGDTPLVLLCPAWKRWGTATTVKPNTVILHSEADDVVPFDDSKELIANSGLSELALIVVGNDHRLADEEALAAMLQAIGSHVTGRDDVQASLARPGAGLPTAQAFLLRYLVFPFYCRITPWEKALARFQAEGEKLVAIAESLSPDQFRRRVLVKAPMGVENSSRYWSAAMVLEHLIEVGSRIAPGVVALTHGEQISEKVDIAAVKPEGGREIEVIEDYRAFVADYVKIISEEVGDKASNLTLHHPWFGELNAHQWVCIGALHQSIHRRQMERIVAGLER
jgi:hypothetical protein